MKIHELAIIFIIIILPISLLLSEYTKFQINTINLQTSYDSKLTKATYDAIKAFQLNMNNSTTSDLANSKIRDLEASINSFRSSLKSSFSLEGYSEDELNRYIPALVYTLYDGFYIYSPYQNTNYQEDSEENGQTMYGLKPYISYSVRYIKGNNDVIITYSLDNYISVKGYVNSVYVNKSGYLIDGIKYEYNEENNTEEVTYNGIEIKNERLSENLPIENSNNGKYEYVKINGTKYYLYVDEVYGDEIVYVLNGQIKVQCKASTDKEEFKYYQDKIRFNDSAKQYYKSAYEFTNWFKGTGLSELTYQDAYDEIINDQGETEIKQLFEGNTNKIFQFNPNSSPTKREEIEKNIENQTSEFNQHRIAIIRHKIETNLAIAVSNYNEYIGTTDNVFQMPDLKENEWEQITKNITLISFLQGINIGGKIYNGYTFVTNTENKEVVLEEDIYILGSDNYYHKIGDKALEDGTVKIWCGDYGYNDGDDSHSSGRINLDFKRQSLINGETYIYYYPLKRYNASYSSVVMQQNVTTYDDDDIYIYISERSDNYKRAFYTALGRERTGKFNSNVNK